MRSPFVSRCGSPFNGAAAAKPRKRQTVDQVRAQLCLQWSRGCEAAEAARARPMACRLSPFNGAAAAKPRKHRRWNFYRHCSLPSMEPRLRSRGSFFGHDNSQDNYDPSMEPRLRSRGSLCPGDARRQGDLRLQWSRGCEAAEALENRPDSIGSMAPSMEPRLRSRGSTLAKPPMGRTQLSFNGAAAAKPRKRYGKAVPASRSNGLQWSRGCEAAEASPRT